jgi:ATP-dependent protease HslVU (ClpYQ) peptidase subunit
LTTILAVADEGWLYMAGDTYTRMYDRSCVDGLTKVHRLTFTDAPGEHVLMGGAGYSSAGLAFASLPELLGPVPAPDADLRQWAGHVSRRVFRFLAKELLDDADGDVSRCAYLIGYREKLFTIVHNGAIAHPDGVAALGSGEGVAIGAYLALKHADWGTNSRARVEQAMRLACTVDGHSNLPFDLLSKSPYAHDMIKSG